ncbi:MAG TPA: ABC transporter substrate-binding protein [Candidatus Limnocylindrales bacterium]|jgi:polar amino acid transport system substrate-binding protein
MRTPFRRASALAAILGLLVAACSGGASPSATTAPPTATASPSEAVSPSPTPDACAAENLETKTAGKLTIGTDNPAFPPYYAPREGGNTEPWDPEWGDPTTGEGFESAVAYAIAEHLGFAEDDVTWVVVPFANSFAPGPKDFDFDINQVTFNEERAQAADLSEGYYFGNQTVVVAEGSEFEGATTVSAFKSAKLGAQIGTTSLNAIEQVIQPTQEAGVYNTNDDAIEALGNGQVDGIVVDLPTAFFIVNVQTEGNVIVGQIGEAAGATPEHFSLVLELDSPLTDCVNQAIAALTDDGTIDDLIAEWLPDATVPELQP